MRVFLMCAGKGERLKELTKDIPKCLLEVGGKPMLDRWLSKFLEWKFSDVLVNMHYKSDKILDYLKNDNCNGARITIYKEKELLGTAGTLCENRKYVRGEYYFGIVYSDVWTSFDMRKMVTFHKRRPAMVTLGLYVPKNYVNKGVAVVKDGIVVGFEEKPKSPKSKFVWSGILVAHPSVFSVVKPGMKDIASDLLPELAKTGRMSAFFIDEPLYDVGESVENYKEINEEVKKMGLQAL